MSRRPLTVHITEDAYREGLEFAEHAMPHETGGVLVGVTTDDGAWVTSFREIPAPSPQPDRFLIPAGKTRPIVDEMRRADPRLGYLGDWHTHPADVGPSGVDLATLVHLAKGTFGARRLLGLLRRTDAGWQLDLWSLGRLRRPRYARLVFTGSLPPPAA